MATTRAPLRYHGTGGSLLGILIVNALLTVLTLGIYSFWAKNKIRVFHYSHTELDGDRFAYHGTGGELFRGALKATGILLLLGIALVLATMPFTMRQAGPAGASPVTPVVVGIAFYAALAVLVAIAINGARRYRLSRSSWRNVRFSFHGRWQDFLALFVKGSLLSLVTLTLYSPIFRNQLRAFLVNNARFGSEPFIYDGDGRELFGQYLKALLLTLPTLGLYWAWYAAFQHRYFWGHTTMRGGRFRSTVTGGGLLKLMVTNLLLVVCTLGIGTPWAITRLHAFWCDNIALYGTVDWASIQQQAQQASATAEGLAEGLDVDIGIGM